MVTYSKTKEGEFLWERRITKRKKQERHCMQLQ